VATTRYYQVVARSQTDHIYVFRCAEEHFDRFMLHLLENPAPLDQDSIKRVILMFYHEKASSDGTTPPTGCH